MPSEPELRLLVVRTHNAVQVYACRGEDKGCDVRTKGGPCADCLLCDDPTESLESVQARINRGNG